MVLFSHEGSKTQREKNNVVLKPTLPHQIILTQRHGEHKGKKYCCLKPNPPPKDYLTQSTQRTQSKKEARSQELEVRIPAQSPKERNNK